MGRKKGRRWNSCLLWFVTSFGAFCLLSSSINASGETGERNEDTPSGTFSDVPKNPGGSSCTEPIELKNLERSKKLVLVSTLDGKLSALDVGEEGTLAWSVEADSSPLLSSSISKLEISHDGVPTRYVPSLDGGLYKFDGDSLEAVPMTADTLLSASFKLADNTVMVGGKDLQSFGIDPRTGEIRYTCDKSGCDTIGEDVTKQEDVLVITRQTQTVRAVDSRAGSEKWNFSVGQHDLKFLKGQHKVITEEAEDGGDEESSVYTCLAEGEDNSAESIERFVNSIKSIVPEGMVVGIDSENPHTVNWQYKFKSPISSIWLLYQGELIKINMFGNNNIPSLSSFETEELSQTDPLLYFGMHQNQLYVQPCSKLREKVSELADRHHISKVPSQFANIPRVAWKPYLNTAKWRTPIMNNRRPQISAENKKHENCPLEDDEHGLTVWHENYPFDNGFYLYPEFSVQVPLADEKDTATDVNQSGDGFDSILDEYIPVSLWNWWKEVIAISVVTSVLVHVILTRVQRGHQLQTAESSNSLTASSSAGTILDPEIQQLNEGNPPSRQNSDETKTEYVSRFDADFDMLEVLGKGGFGVVFETKNKVDDCHYAVKRIALPNSEGQKEKVMREVKALAKLDHMGIVRYFHAWIESPPLGWQEEKDRELEESEMPATVNTDVLSTGSEVTRLSPGNTPPKSSLLDPGGDNGRALKCNISPKPSPLDFLQNPFGGSGFDFSESNIKRGSSEEFSVHNRGDSFWGKDSDGDSDIDEEDEEESGSFSCGMGTPNLGGFHIDDSVDIEFCLSDDDASVEQSNNNNRKGSSSPQNIPFSNSDRSSNSSRSRHSRLSENNDSLQIVFEDSGCAENKSSKESSADVCIGIPSSQSGDWLASTKTHSKSHSRTPSKDLAKITIEKEGKSTGEKPAKSDSVSRKSGEMKPKLYLYIQMQLCKRETLKDWLSCNTLNRDRHMVLDMFDQITCAIEYVHDSGLMHRDLKPSNIFFSLDGVIKMGDFGLVQTAFPNEQHEEIYRSGNPYKKHTAQVGTTMYMSPEQMSGKVYSQKVDIFSLGLILFEMLYPFATNMERVSTLLKVKQQIFPERFCREMENEHGIVKQLLSSNPGDRPTAKEILADDLLREFEHRRIPRHFRTRTISQNSS